MICVSLSLICIHYHQKLDEKKSGTTYGIPCNGRFHELEHETPSFDLLFIKDPNFTKFNRSLRALTAADRQLKSNQVDVGLSLLIDPTDRGKHASAMKQQKLKIKQYNRMSPSDFQKASNARKSVLPVALVVRGSLLRDTCCNNKQDAGGSKGLRKKKINHLLKKLHHATWKSEYYLQHCSKKEENIIQWYLLLVKDDRLSVIHTHPTITSDNMPLQVLRQPNVDYLHMMAMYDPNERRLSFFPRTRRQELNGNEELILIGVLHDLDNEVAVTINRQLNMNNLMRINDKELHKRNTIDQLYSVYEQLAHLNDFNDRLVELQQQQNRKRSVNVDQTKQDEHIVSQQMAKEYFLNESNRFQKAFDTNLIQVLNEDKRKTMNGPHDDSSVLQHAISPTNGFNHKLKDNRKYGLASYLHNLTGDNGEDMTSIKHWIMNQHWKRTKSLIRNKKQCNPQRLAWLELNRLSLQQSSPYAKLKSNRRVKFCDAESESDNENLCVQLVNETAIACKCQAMVLDITDQIRIIREEEEYECMTRTTKGMFKCLNRQIIRQELICNGHKDCDDDSDESGVYFTCAVEKCNSEDQFLCKTSRQCITKQHVCNGIQDCSAGEDENNCRTHMIVTLLKPVVSIQHNSHRCDDSGTEEDAVQSPLLSDFLNMHREDQSIRTRRSSQKDGELSFLKNRYEVLKSQRLSKNSDTIKRFDSDQIYGRVERPTYFNTKRTNYRTFMVDDKFVGRNFILPLETKMSGKTNRKSQIESYNSDQLYNNHETDMNTYDRQNYEKPYTTLEYTNIDDREENPSSTLINKMQLSNMLFVGKNQLSSNENDKHDSIYLLTFSGQRSTNIGSLPQIYRRTFQDRSVSRDTDMYTKDLTRHRKTHPYQSVKRHIVRACDEDTRSSKVKKKHAISDQNYPAAIRKESVMKTKHHLSDVDDGDIEEKLEQLLHVYHLLKRRKNSKIIRRFDMNERQLKTPPEDNKNYSKKFIKKFQPNSKPSFVKSEVARSEISTAVVVSLATFALLFAIVCLVWRAPQTKDDTKLSYKTFPLSTSRYEQKTINEDTAFPFKLVPNQKVQSFTLEK
ncbi:unnamed protein product [Didymodactylos carnosus]|uniref:Uncharacterized protein n=1 Tax=Didymodactylos carnosus TaxID=1234261 RepID=A0A813YTW0_9BILA|nr:unnamed protein product [Didymodactylos carnosus]CAF3674203.1 unnamed protein product [Didymodactylos carnosus]